MNHVEEYSRALDMETPGQDLLDALIASAKQISSAGKAPPVVLAPIWVLEAISVAPVKAAP